MADVESLIESIDSGDQVPIYLVAGDRVVSEPAGLRIADKLAELVGAEVEVRKRPDDMGALLADLQTFSLFSRGKVVVAVDTALLAERGAAAALIDDAAKALPLAARGSKDDIELSGGERRAATRLFQALRLFQIDPYAASPSGALGELPDWALAGGPSVRRNRPRGRPKKEAAKLKDELSALLEAGRNAGIQGASETVVAGLADILERGLPESHFLILVESSVAADHPLVVALTERKAFARLSQVTAGRRGWEGLEPLVAELEQETGVRIEPPALEELAARTLRRKSTFARAGDPAEAESSGRFAAEYRKLSALAEGDRITSDLVRETTQDRGEQDVWSILDSIGSGGSAGAGQALAKLDRYLASATDPIAARLSLWALLAGFCRQLTAISGALSSRAVSPGERNYRTFKDRVAPKLQSVLPSGASNPIASLHPYRLHRAYLAASRAKAERLATLPARVAQTELLLKGGSTAPEAALVAFVSDLATAIDA